MKIKQFIPIFLVCLMVTMNNTTLFANAETEKVIIKVAGLYCPFCSYGLEKQVKKIDGFKSLQINIKEGTAEIEFQPGTKVSEKAILTAVEDAGFELDGVEWISKGKKK